MEKNVCEKKLKNVLCVTKKNSSKNAHYKNFLQFLFKYLLTKFSLKKNVIEEKFSHTKMLSKTKK